MINAQSLEYLLLQLEALSPVIKRQKTMWQKKFLFEELGRYRKSIPKASNRAYQLEKKKKSFKL